MSEEPAGQGRLATRLVALGLLGGLGLACFLVLRPFLSALLWAAILAFTTWPAYRVLTDRVRLRPSWAAAVMVAAMMLIIGLPLALSAPTSAAEVEALRRGVEGLFSGGMPAFGVMLGRLPLVGGSLQGLVEGLDLGVGGLFEMVRPYLGGAAQLGLGAVLALLSGVAEFLIAILLSFFFYRDGPRLAAALNRAAERLAGERGRRLIVLTGAVTQGVIYGLLGTAVAQGVLTTLGLWLAGVPRPVLFGVVAGVLSILPVGAPLVWLPASLWLLFEGRTGWGIFMALYGALVISSVDNFIRPWLIARGADLPLLLTILGALGGAVAFGLLGLFLGPVVLAVAYSVIRDWLSDGAGKSPR